MIMAELRRRAVRNGMSALAVTLSVAMLLTMLSFAEGLHQRVLSDIRESREDILVTTESFAGVADGHSLADDISGLDGVKHAAPFLAYPMLAAPDRSSSGRLIACMGIVPELSRPFLNDNDALVFDEFRIEFDGWFAEGGDPHYADGGYDGRWTGEALVDRALAERYGLGIGDPLYMTVIGAAGLGEFHVRGFFGDGLAGEGLATDIVVGAAVVHLSELQSMRSGSPPNPELPAGDVAGGAGAESSEGALADPDDDTADALDDETDAGVGTHVAGTNGTHPAADDSVTGISVMVQDDGTVDDMARELKDMFPYYTVNTRQDRVALLEERVAWVRTLYVITGSVALLIGLMFVVTIMVMSVHERTSELGMMRAIGISRRTIFVQVLGQSVIVILIGSAAGAVAGYFSSQAISDHIASHYGLERELSYYSPEMVLASVGLILLFGVLFSAYPAWRAVRVDVVKALKHVG